MIEKVRSFGGQVDAISPLGIEAVFGIDRTEDPPRRAAHVALAIRRQLSRGATPAPPMRMAIHACPVLVVHPGGAGGIEAESKRQIAPLLDALLAAAEPGTIAVSGSAAAFLRRRFILRADGQATPGLGLYRLSGHEELDASGWGHTAALVDREQELALLRVRLDAALGGQGQLVAVLGDPGMGKSRMVWEFVHSDAIRPARVLETGSMYASITPSLAVTELLRRFFDVHPESDVASVRAAVTAQVSGRHPHLGHVVPALLSLLEVADPEWERLEPAERRHRTRQAVTQLLVSESRLQPLVVVVEDVHWMDSESQAVFDMLVGALPSASLLLVVTYRPPFHHEWGDIRHSTLLSLGPLSADAAGELLVGLLGSDPSLEPVTRRLVEYTGGNPFFLEESVQALVETGALEGDRGAYRAPRPLLTFEAPATVEGVLAERIDRLAAESKALIQAAAAIGAETPLALLAAVVDLEPEALQRGLEQLLATELLFESRATRERQLMFKHALIREVAYRSLLPETRRDLHQAIVVAIEAGGAAGAAEQVDRLAHHAYHGELWGAAARYLRQAGDRALRSAALDQASEYFERALEALGRRRDTRDVRHDSVDIRLRLRDALWPQVQLPSILRHLREADALAVALADRRRQGWIACYLSQYFWAAGDLERAHEASDRALALARSLGNQALLAESNVYRGVIQFSLGAFRQAAETFSAGLDLLEEVIAHDAAEFPSPRFVQNGPVILLSFLARSLAELGDFPEALARGREASRRATASGSAFATAAAGGGLGCVFLRKGENARAVEILEPALRVCRTHGFNHWMPTVGGALGAAYVRLGRVEEGRALLQECVDHGDQLGLAASNSLWVIYLGEASLRAGRPAEALALGRRALRLCQERRERGYEAWALHLLALIAALGPTPDVDEASVRYQQALALGQEAAMRPLIAHCHLGLGTLLARTASREAERHLRTAAEGFATLGVVTSDGPLATAWRHAPAVPDGDAPRC
jgi:tetratricopeptide (TPR) repeat protein